RSEPARPDEPDRVDQPEGPAVRFARGIHRRRNHHVGNVDPGSERRNHHVGHVRRRDHHVGHVGRRDDPLGHGSDLSGRAMTTANGHGARAGSPRALCLYLQLVCAAGASALVASALTAVHTPHPLWWLALATLAMVTGSFRLKFASVSADIAIDDT